MNSLTLATDPGEAAALDAARTYRTRLAGELAGRVALLITAADRAPGAVPDMHAGLVDFCERVLLPHTAAEEVTLHAAARGRAGARLLVEGLVAERHRLTGLVGSLRDAATPARAAAEARALQVLLDAHTEKENDLVLPLLAAAPDVSLAGLVAELRRALPGYGSARPEDDGSPEEDEACCGACTCGARDEPVPELDVRTVPRAKRHATVIGALDTVRPGGALELIAPHDPLALLAHIERRSPGRFTVARLERGPQDWRLRFSRH
ncbi:DUF2249 domain-containing protein [Streptomyces sp. RFCAC02]|uniref:DUF2249 domain-containing protein n=1 Tax=Streptomyces sp. RFCAC02 TaxID=2499143 RepID=UPI0010206590|nr:DUF2249 domain-containing protein [Streptomyces sp. RFCAC02]